jgi:hypothetical protein
MSVQPVLGVDDDDQLLRAVWLQLHHLVWGDCRRYCSISAMPMRRSTSLVILSLANSQAADHLWASRRRKRR